MNTTKMAVTGARDAEREICPLCGRPLEMDNERIVVSAWDGKTLVHDDCQANLN